MLTVFPQQAQIMAHCWHTIRTVDQHWSSILCLMGFRNVSCHQCSDRTVKHQSWNWQKKAVTAQFSSEQLLAFWLRTTELSAHGWSITTLAQQFVNHGRWRPHGGSIAVTAQQCTNRGPPCSGWRCYIRHLHLTIQHEESGFPGFPGCLSISDESTSYNYPRNTRHWTNVG